MKTILTLLLAILWLPVSSHCLLFESTDGFEFLSCCTHIEANATTEGAATEHEDECATDACAYVEGANYKSSLQRVSVPPLDTHVVFELPPLLETALTATTTGTHQSNDALTQLPVSWQFSARTALSPRAPSFVS